MFEKMGVPNIEDMVSIVQSIAKSVGDPISSADAEWVVRRQTNYPLSFASDDWEKECVEQASRYIHWIAMVSRNWGPISLTEYTVEGVANFLNMDEGG